MQVRGAGRVRFLLLRHTIAAELAEGWPMAEIYRRHQDRLGIQVGQFRTYVKLYVSPEQRWTGRNAGAAERPAIKATPPRLPAAPPELRPRVTRSVNLKREDLI